MHGLARWQTPYDGVTAAGDRQRDLVRGGGAPTARKKAQEDVWRALSDFEVASRSVTPCSPEALDLRLMSIEMGGLAGTMLTVQEALDAARDPADIRQLRAQWLKTGGELRTKIEKFNRAGAALAASTRTG